MREISTGMGRTRTTLSAILVHKLSFFILFYYLHLNVFSQRLRVAFVEADAVSLLLQLLTQLCQLCLRPRRSAACRTLGKKRKKKKERKKGKKEKTVIFLRFLFLSETFPQIFTSSLFCVTISSLLFPSFFPLPPQHRKRGKKQKKIGRSRK